MKRTAIYAGTFDPITLGHMDVVHRGLKLFDRIVIGVAENPKKGPMFDLDTRLAMVRESLADESAVDVVGFKGLLVNLAHEHNAHALLRGLRAASDFEYEFQMACMNSRLDETIETIFLPASEKNQFISSKLVKEIASMNGDISAFVIPEIEEKLMNHYKNV